MMYGALDIADYFLSQLDVESGDALTNMKLQKLLYYAQGFHLAMYDEPLFREPIEKWTHGPVVPEVYHFFKANGARSIPTDDIECPELDDQSRELLDEVYAVYGEYSASTLRNLTHNEPPWVQARERGEISLDAMRSYFKTQLAQD